MIESLVDRFCWWLVRKLPHRTKKIVTDGQDYLLRFYIKHNGLFPGIYLHRFLNGDGDRELHNHPWIASCSLILTGGYVEERLVHRNDPHRKAIITRELKPGHFNFLSGKAFHRIHLVDSQIGTWTLFVSGKEVKNWGFLNFETDEVIPWEIYLADR